MCPEVQTTDYAPSSQNRNGDFDRLLTAARSGRQAAIDALIESCRPYLLLIANQDWDNSLRRKLAASDLVQETIFTAHGAIDGFRGSSKQQFLAWLRGILAHDMSDARRKYRGTAKRQIGRELCFDDGGQESGTAFQIAATNATPSAQAIAAEEASELERAMNRLSPVHREVLEMRNWQQLSFSTIGQRIGRSADATRKLWSRAVVQLQQELTTDEGKRRSEFQ